MDLCRGITRSGERCKHRQIGEYCSQHVYQDIPELAAGVPVPEPDPFAGWPFFWSDKPPGVACGQPFISGRWVSGSSRSEAWHNWLDAYEAGELFENVVPADFLLAQEVKRHLDVAPFYEVPIDTSNRILESGQSDPHYESNHEPRVLE